MAPSNAAKPVPECSGNRPRDIDSLAASDTSTHNEVTGNSQGKNRHSPAVAEAGFPTFFELVAANSVGFLYGIIAYSNSCLSMMDADDLDGFVDSVSKLLRQANGLASIARPLKKPTIISHERADRFEREAAALRDRAYLLETEASRHRAASSLGRNAP
jgi:hypothetical protein